MGNDVHILFLNPTFVKAVENEIASLHVKSIHLWCAAEMCHYV